MVKKLLTFMLLQCAINFAFAANYLTFTAEKAGSKFGIYNSEDNEPDVQYSLDGGATWKVLQPSDRVELKNVGDKALLKGNNPDGFSTAFEQDGKYYYDFTQFMMTGKIAASGSVMSLIDGEGTSTTIPSNGCFYRLFNTCIALTTAPELPATTLRNQCYQEMFYDCTSLTKAPELPATTLFPGCYMYMFYFCENLEESPYLPATKFFKDYSGDASRFLPCYGGMFGKCRSLKKISVNIPDWGEEYEVRDGVFGSNTGSWVTDVNTQGGIFVCPESLPLEYGVDRIPRTWIVKSLKDEYANYLTFSAEEDNSTFGVESHGENTPNLQYSLDGGKTWIDLKAETAITLKSKGDQALIRGTNPDGFSIAENQYTKFTMTGKIAASGSVMSLIDGSGETIEIPNGFCFTHLFEDCASLIQAPALPAKRLTNNCYEYMFSGCTNLAQAPELPAKALAAECYEGMFIRCSKFRVAPELPATTLADYCYYNMFAGCKGIINAPALPAKTLADHCYYNMFSGCTFTKAPELPATTLVDGCYSGMFSGCENLSQIKVNFTEWNETSTAEWVYGVAPIGYFICPKALAEETGANRIPKGWILKHHINYLTFTAEEDSVTFGIENHGDNIPDLQYSLDGGETWFDLKADTAITLASKGDQALLRGTNPEGFSKAYYLYTRFLMTGKIAASGSVMSLIDGSGETTAIPNDFCFTHLFEFCTGLTHAPELPAKKMTSNCYEYMFSDCSSLVEAPALPAKTLAAECYKGMFIRCPKIRVAPELPATTLADYCYSQMFGGCDGIIKAPELPATTLADYCYYKMFGGCTFTKAPELPATTLAEGCYDGMFINCENLSQIKVNFTEWNETSTAEWVYGVAPIGYFICPKALAEEIGSDRIPEGWILKYIDDMKPNYLTFTAEEESSTFAVHYSGSVAGTRNYNPDIQYSLDGGKTWTDLTEEMTITLKEKGDKALLRGYNPEGLSINSNKYTKFIMTGKIAASGSVMSLVDERGNSTVIPSAYCFSHLFEKCTSLTQAPELPATTLAEYCYYNMFNGCSSLEKAPELPATTLAASCYDCMFYACKNLTQAPELPATTMTDRCYIGMFNRCSSLTQAPKLPATTLAYRCYFDMFVGCTSLTQAPTLPATTMANECYLGMFYGCTNLTQAPELPATTLAEACYWQMFYYCKNLTQAPELPATTLAEGCYRAMFEGCSSLTQAPELPATTLQKGCYREMFKNCSNLTEAPKLPSKVLAGNLANDCYINLFAGCQKLSQIEVGLTRWDWYSTTDWVKNVAPTGTFICSKELALEYGDDRIPVGWRVEYIEDIIEDCVDLSNYTTAYSGGVSYTDNRVSEVLDNGYTAEIGTFTLVDSFGIATIFGGKADCAFKANWGAKTSDDYMVGVGYQDNTASKRYTDLGDIYAVYKYTKSGKAGAYSYIGVHGWMKDPLYEYYIVDDTFEPNANGLFYGANTKGYYIVDGVEYKLMVAQRFSTPSIEGNTNFQQIFAVRSSYQTSGAINVTEHFKNWENFGLELGNLYDCKILCNVGGGTGSIEYTCASMSWKGHRSSLGDLSCSIVELTNVSTATASGVTVWTSDYTIYVRGAEGAVSLYDLDGRFISTSTATSDIHTLTAPAQGIYLVRTNGETFTTIVK